MLASPAFGESQNAETEGLLPARVHLGNVILGSVLAPLQIAHQLCE